MNALKQTGTGSSRGPRLFRSYTRIHATLVRRVRRAQAWDRVYVSREVLFPLQPGDPTKLPAAILRGAPFGLSSPTREECNPLSWKYCYPLPAGFIGLKRGIECTSRGECCSPSFPSGFPPPLGKSAVLLKCGIYFSSFLIKFESRIKIIKRRTE